MEAGLDSQSAAAAAQGVPLLLGGGVLVCRGACASWSSPVSEITNVKTETATGKNPIPVKGKGASTGIAVSGGYIFKVSPVKFHCFGIIALVDWCFLNSRKESGHYSVA